jgi:UDP-glucose 4-epimerase
VLFAAPAKAQAELRWTPKLGDLETIVRTAWEWHRSHPRGYDEKK